MCVRVCMRVCVRACVCCQSISQELIEEAVRSWHLIPSFYQLHTFLMALFTILGTFYDISIITLVGSNVKELELSLCGNDYGENDFICLFVSSIFLFRVAHFPKFISLYLYPPHTHRELGGRYIGITLSIYPSIYLSIFLVSRIPSIFQNFAQL